MRLATMATANRMLFQTAAFTMPNISGTNQHAQRPQGNEHDAVVQPSKIVCCAAEDYSKFIVNELAQASTPSRRAVSTTVQPLDNQATTVPIL